MSLPVLVTISGLPGSGTSTVARAVAEALGIERLDGGTVFRALAAEHGLTLVEFGAQAERDPAIDLELDTRLAARAAAGDVVLESRLAGWIATNEDLDATRVWIACAEDERAGRVGRRDALDVDAALVANRDREASEAARYRTYYGVDIADLSIYDLVVDSTTLPPPTIVEMILQKAGTDRFGPNG
ncbi:MAG: cytidylate kinase family protein [Actinomycetota bacterium]|nr:cytidylate kinase family protein [Acidimicrobiia bacterium]MDQ3293508.1 cytidylate kinase family protein [Actinomycetota bacterium]